MFYPDTPQPRIPALIYSLHLATSADTNVLWLLAIIFPFFDAFLKPFISFELS